MFNPFCFFSQPLLDSFIKGGKTYFVRNVFPRAFDHFDDSVKHYFLFTHYDDHSKAQAHYEAIAHDKYRFLYKVDSEEHLNKLKLAASQPEGYKIYSTLFVPDWKNRITKDLKQKANRYMYKNTNWKPGKCESIHLDLHLQFGELYFTMTYNGHKIITKFVDIEKS